MHLTIGIVDSRPVTRQILGKSEHLLSKRNDKIRANRTVSKGGTMYKRRIAHIRIGRSNRTETCRKQHRIMRQR